MKLPRPRPEIALIVAYPASAFPLQVWAELAGPLPWLNYGHGWSSMLAYWLGAPVAAALLWRRSPRARLAAYVFFAFDALRSLRLAHHLPLALDVAAVLYLLTPPMLRLYPSMWSRSRAWRRHTSS